MLPNFRYFLDRTLCSDCERIAFKVRHYGSNYLGIAVYIH